MGRQSIIPSATEARPLAHMQAYTASFFNQKWYILKALENVYIISQYATSHEWVLRNVLLDEYWLPDKQTFYTLSLDRLLLSFPELKQPIWERESITDINMLQRMFDVVHKNAFPRYTEEELSEQWQEWTKELSPCKEV